MQPWLTSRRRTARRGLRSSPAKTEPVLTTTPRPWALHERHERLAAEEDARDVHAEALGEVGLGQVEERASRERGSERASGVVDEDIHAPEPLHRLIREPLYGVVVGYVGWHGEHLRARRLDLRLRLGELLRTPGGDDDARTSLRECERDALADAVASAGDDGYLPIELHASALRVGIPWRAGQGSAHANANRTTHANRACWISIAVHTLGE